MRRASAVWQGVKGERFQRSAEGERRTRVWLKGGWFSSPSVHEPIGANYSATRVLRWPK
jgi:hypothetical protein